MERRWPAVLGCVLAFAVSLCVVYVALAVRALDCDADYDSECSSEGLVQLWVAVAGLIPSTLAVVGSIRGKGRTGIWFGAACGVYVVWGFASRLESLGVSPRRAEWRVLVRFARELL